MFAFKPHLVKIKIVVSLFLICSFQFLLDSSGIAPMHLFLALLHFLADGMLNTNPGYFDWNASFSNGRTKGEDCRYAITIFDGLLFQFFAAASICG